MLYLGRIDRIATEYVVLHLLQTKCIQILLYGLEDCPLTVTYIRKTDLNSLDFVVNRFLRNWSSQIYGHY